MVLRGDRPRRPVKSADWIQFDVLLRGSREGSSQSGWAAELRARAEDLEACRVWLLRRGVRCDATSFGLACAAPQPTFVALFGSLSEPKAPSELRPLVAQVTLAQSLV